jgi:hypothetical protein
MELREWKWLFVRGWRVQERGFFIDGFFKTRFKMLDQSNGGLNTPVPGEG